MDIKYKYFILLSSLLFRVSVKFKVLSLFLKILKDIPIIWPATAKVSPLRAKIALQAHPAPHLLVTHIWRIQNI